MIITLLFFLFIHSAEGSQNSNSVQEEIEKVEEQIPPKAIISKSKNQKQTVSTTKKKGVDQTIETLDEESKQTQKTSPTLPPKNNSSTKTESEIDKLETSVESDVQEELFEKDLESNDFKELPSKNLSDLQKSNQKPKVKKEVQKSEKPPNKSLKTEASKKAEKPSIIRETPISLEDKETADSHVDPDSAENISENSDESLKYDGTRVKKIKHPLSKSGLYKITAEGHYLYKTERTPQDHGGSFRIGSISLENFSNPKNSNVTFQSIYGDESSAILLIDYEWQLTQTGGKLGWKVGSGLMTASGKGRFVSDSSPALEEFNFFLFPNSVAGIYRFQYWERQWFVPFVELGVDYFTFIELRDDDKGAKLGGTAGAHAAGGISFSLTALDKNNLAVLDQEYGVNNLWLTIELRALLGLNQAMDISSNFLNAGILVEF